MTNIRSYKVIAETEPVLVIATRGDAPMVKMRFASASAVHVITHPINDGWIRDNGPIFAKSPDGIVALDFKFNSWGNRFSPSDGDCSVSQRICSELNVRAVEVSWVLEGGAVTFNGERLAVASAECILNPNRNGPTSAAEAEAIISEKSGCKCSDMGSFRPYRGFEEYRWPRRQCCGIHCCKQRF